jgi:hypothetical protein
MSERDMREGEGDGDGEKGDRERVGEGEGRRDTGRGEDTASGKTRIVNFPIIINNFNNHMRVITVISVFIIISTCLPPSNLATC